MKIKLFYITLFLILGFTSHAQNCKNYHVENCRWGDRSYFYSRQSRSALFAPGTTSKFNIVVYKGEEYYISIEGHRKLGDLRLRLLEDDEGKTVLYDNADFKYENYFYFKNATTKKLIVEVSAPGAEDPDEKEARYCVGVLLLFRS